MPAVGRLAPRPLPPCQPPAHSGPHSGPGWQARPGWSPQVPARLGRAQSVERGREGRASAAKSAAALLPGAAGVEPAELISGRRFCFGIRAGSDGLSSHRCWPSRDLARPLPFPRSRSPPRKVTAETLAAPPPDSAAAHPRPFAVGIGETSVTRESLEQPELGCKGCLALRPTSGHV